MKLYSTNNKNNIVDLKEAVLNAFPEDKGLYMPSQIPRIPDSFFKNIEQFSFAEIGFMVTSWLTQGAIPEKELYGIIHRAINFPAPVVEVEKDIYSLELFHGPTLAFKDFGARFMAELMSYFLSEEERETTILVATSGDTGGAVAAGFHKVPGIKVFVLYPSGKVSPLQEKQLTTHGDNIHAVEVQGTFDDCQALVKEAMVNPELKSAYNFSSANSINIARLIPQSFYYFNAYKQLKDKSKKIVVSVPSGNFGNLTAGLIAKKMGLPIHSFIAATNLNKVVPDYLKSGNFVAKPSIATLSNAMDVGNPSNFPRMLALYEKEGSTWNDLVSDLSGDAYNDSRTLSAIRDVNRNSEYLLDPHGAIGYLACKKHKVEEENCQYIFLETAHPGKFSDVMEKAIGEISIPENLLAYQSKDKVATLLAADFKQFKDFLLA